jgi:hypothetical protein
VPDMEGLEIFQQDRPQLPDKPYFFGIHVQVFKTPRLSNLSKHDFCTAGYWRKERALRLR